MFAEPLERGFDLTRRKGRDRVAVRLLVAGRDESVEGERVVLRRRLLFLEKRAENADLHRVERAREPGGRGVVGQHAGEILDHERDTGHDDCTPSRRFERAGTAHSCKTWKEKETIMKIKSILLAGAVAALPLAAFAQQQPSQEQPPWQQASKQQVTMNESGDMKVVTTEGTVQAYEAGRSITITTASGEQVTYTINESSDIPKTVEIGKTVTIRTTSGSGAPVVKTVTITTTTKETKRKSY